jgi:PAS domain S-box-containing protein
MGAQTIPSNDLVFRRAVDAAMRTSATSNDLVEQLQPLYPEVRVVERELSGEPRLLYVYRDGSLFPPDDAAWWEAPDASAVTISTSTGLITHANEHVGSIFGVRPDAIVGRPFTDFVLPGAAEAARASLATIFELGEARSTARLLRGDGNEVQVEFRAVLVPDGVRVWYRPATTSKRARMAHSADAPPILDEPG